MSWMRFFHSVAAYALVLGLVVRVYMAFNSAFERDWKEFSVNKSLRDLPDILGYDLFLKKLTKNMGNTIRCRRLPISLLPC